jgi:2-oxoglutarate ferredoxin oxidoreductase subunit beta
MMTIALKAKGYKTQVKPIWCPRCGDFGILSALYKTFEEFQIQPHETVVVSGIGCAARIPAFINTYGFHGVHGRILPIALGIKLSNPKLKVIGIGGDGDAFAIGMGHFPHAIRRNLDMLYIVLDNSVYGLTKGQSSPTSKADHLTKTNPFGVDGDPIDPVPLALAAGAGFVARIFAGDMPGMRQILPQAFQHKGFAFIHAISPCSTFFDTYDYYQARIKPLPDDYDSSNKLQAMEYGSSEEPLYTGIFYRAIRPTFEERYQQLIAEKCQSELTIKELAKTWSR